MAAPSAGVGHCGLGVPDHASPMDLPEFPTSGARDLIRHECEAGLYTELGYPTRGLMSAGPMYRLYRRNGANLPPPAS